MIFDTVIRDLSAFTIAAYGLILAFLLVYPLYSAWALRPRRFLGWTAEETSQWRRRDYLETIAVQWLVSGLIAGLVLRGDLTLADLRLVPDFGVWQLLAAGLAAAICGAVLWQARTYRRRPELRAQFREQIGHLDALMPRTQQELRWFGALSLTAGFCEELLYRGFLLAVLTPWLGFWPAAFLSTAAFGFGHLYQGGLHGVVRTAALGAAMLSVVELAGSIWPAVALHFVFDVVGGYLGFLCHRDKDLGDKYLGDKYPGDKYLGAEATETISHQGKTFQSRPI